MKPTEAINISEIKEVERVRLEMGKIVEMADSIEEFGLIEPIILTGESEILLVAGGRRLAALRLLRDRELRKWSINSDGNLTKWDTLRHGDPKLGFLWREDLESDPLRRQSIELEENLKRKELTWQEQITGKQRLFELMQKLHGVAAAGGRTRRELITGESKGFGLRKLAAMLGENVRQTHKDIQLAKAVKQMPSLLKADTKESARRKLSIAGAVADMRISAALKLSTHAATQGASTKIKYWTLHEGDFRDNAHQIPDESVDLVYTDLPYGVGLNTFSKHTKGVIDYGDDRDELLGAIPVLLQHTRRVLHPDRYCVFFFGFNYFNFLVEELEANGLQCNPVPVVWYKHTRSAENPNTRYANAYDAAIVAWKGNPVFIRPGQTNVVDIPAIVPSDRLQIAQQPVALVDKFLLDMTTEGATVLDWMCGSGTTGVACVKSKRHCILFEKSHAAYVVAKARLEAL